MSSVCLSNAFQLLHDLLAFTACSKAQSLNSSNEPSFVHRKSHREREREKRGKHGHPLTVYSLVIPSTAINEAFLLELGRGGGM